MRFRVQGFRYKLVCPNMMERCSAKGFGLRAWGLKVYGFAVLKVFRG